MLTQVGLDTFVDPRREGGAMNAPRREDHRAHGRVRRRRLAVLRDRSGRDVAIIRGTTADERGNLSMEHEARLLGALDQALAARNNGGIVIAQVKRLARRPARCRPARSTCPASLVDVVVVDPDQMQTTQTRLRPGDQRRVSAPIWAALEADAVRASTR